MTSVPQPSATVYAPNGMVASVDHLASSAGVAALRDGGTAVDAAISANAVLTVTAQNMCGLGGDLFALVHQPGRPITCLNASGRAGSGSDPDRLRAEGHTTMPFKGDIRSVPVPGCVDGWQALHDRYGRLPLERIVAPAIELAENGFAASPLLARSVTRLAGVEGADDFVTDPPLQAGGEVRRPGVGRTLRGIGEHGRSGFYAGEVGERLLELGDGEFVPEDLERSQADWVEPLVARVWDHDMATVPPNSQGYLSLAGALIADQLELPDDLDDPVAVHLLIEAARQAAFDRPEVLHEHADGNALLAPDRLAPRAAAISAERAAAVPDAYRGGGTMYLCTVDATRMGVSLIQSNAAGFGADIVVPGTGIHLQNRGAGFSLEPGHPAEYGPGRRPPHTLAPALVSRPDGELRAVLGTMGGDAQPQIVLQMLARLLVADQSPGTIITSPRWVLDTPGGNGFDTWTNSRQPQVVLEEHAPPAWQTELERQGHEVVTRTGGHGHAHLIEVSGPMLRGAADPRAVVGSATGY